MGISERSYYRHKKAGTLDAVRGSWVEVESSTPGEPPSIADIKKSRQAVKTAKLPKSKAATVSVDAAKSAKSLPNSAKDNEASANKDHKRGGIANLIPFVPGVSGNPSGRPKADKTLKALAREHSAEAIQTLAAIMKDTGATPSARVGAAQALLDRGHGRPLQQLEVGEAGAFSEMDDRELDTVIAKMAGQLAMLTQDDSEHRIVN